MGQCLPTSKNEFTIAHTNVPSEFDGMVYSIARCDVLEIIIWLQRERQLTFTEKAQIIHGLQNYFKTNICRNKYFQIKINNQIFIFESRVCPDTGFMTIFHFTS
jgi:hypothetical protein